MFVDEITLHVRGGNGGSGVTSFSRQPFEPKGPPDGGDGGHGGEVRLVATRDVATLLDFHHRPHRQGGNGRNGEGDLRTGARGKDEALRVPIGTVVTTDGGGVLGDLAHEGAELVVAEGGRGGRGNAAFRNRTRRAPKFHEFGEKPEWRTVRLELKLVADVALVGFPNAGKSSLISVLSAAKPKIADYPFTTLSPNLGVVRSGDIDYVMADVPGLLEGASEGRGLGHRFLRHVERAGVLVHVLDCASYEMRDPREDLHTVVAELRRYERQMELVEGMPPLTERPAVVWLNKADADPDTAEIIRPDLEDAGWEVLEGSAVTRAGTEALRHRLGALVTQARAEQPVATAAPSSARPVLRPTGRKSRDFSVHREHDVFAVRGARIERWIGMTDLSNDDAVRYLQGRLQAAGVERALIAAGAREGDAVDLGGYVFDFSPELADLPDVELEELDGPAFPDADDPDADADDAGAELEDDVDEDRKAGPE